MWLACPPPLLITFWRMASGTLVDLAEQLLDRLGLQIRVAGQGGVEVVHVGLVVLAVVDLHRHLVDGLFQGVGRVGQGGRVNAMMSSWLCSSETVPFTG